MEAMFLRGSLARDRRSQLSFEERLQTWEQVCRNKRILTVLRLFSADLFEATPRRALRHVAEVMWCWGPRLSV